MSSITPLAPKSPTFNWRAHLRAHPAAELYPLLAKTDSTAFKELVDDIKANGLIEPLVFWSDNNGPRLLDGRNRLDALAQLGLLYETPDHHLGCKKWGGKQWTGRPGDRVDGFDCKHLHDGDPYAIALSPNVHRRHLNAEQKRDLIAKVLKAKPEASNLQIARQTKVDDKTIAKVRAALESRSEIPNVKKRVDSKGRKQPAKRKGKVEKTPNSIVKSDSIIASPAPIKAAINVEPETEPALAAKLPSEAGGTLDSIIEREWLEAERALEALASHSPARAADVISPSKISLIAETAAWLMDLKTELMARAAGNGEAPVAGSDCSIPDDLSIPHCLQRGA
jgi:hypothetical protein